MAFDDNSIPKDLRPLNIVRTVVDDPRAAPVTSSARPNEGYYANPPYDAGGSPGSRPAVYYPTTGPDPRFVNLGYNNVNPGVNRWVNHVAMNQPQLQPQLANGHTSPHNSGPRVGATASDHASDEGNNDDSSSERKVKFLCSFGGKILPRPSDGTLRYVGGQTRILSVKRDVTFSEFVQKMNNTYGHSGAIKYQLPDEDLDALVTVSSPDDLENMMDEYEKLTDGSAKLRIFLFLHSDVESVDIRDIQDGGQRYVEAVNGITDGFIIEPLARKESIESAGSAQNSELSGTEGENVNLPFNDGLSPRVKMGPTTDLSPNSELYVDPLGAPLSIPMVNTVPATNLDHGIEQDSLHGVNLPAPTYKQAIQEPVNYANYAPYPSQMGFPSQNYVAAGGYMYPPHQQMQAGASSQQFPPPPMHMTMNPAFLTMNPNAVQQHVIQQPQQVRFEHYPVESTLPPRVVQFPTEQGYNWHQIQRPAQMGFTEGVIPRFDDCHMCQKALPHAHSDSLAQEQKESPLSNVSDSRPLYQSLQLNDTRPIIRHGVNVSNGNQESGNVQFEGNGFSQNTEEQYYMNDKTMYQKAENSSNLMMTSGIQSPYGGVYVMNTRPQYQVVQGGGASLQAPEYSFCETPAEYSGTVAAGIPKEDYLRQIDGRLENLHVRPSEILPNDDQNKFVADSGENREVTTEPSPLNNLLPYPPNLNLGANHLGSDDTGGSPINTGVDLVSENSTSLFSNQDPWNLRQDTTHFPPPRPKKIIRENLGAKDPPFDNRFINNNESPTSNGWDSLIDSPLESGSYLPSANLNQDFSIDRASSNKDSTEELIKQELQAVAEGVVASVLHSSVPSNPDSTPTNQQFGEVQYANTEKKEKFEEIKAKLPEKINLGFPASDGIGRLQIIKNSDLEELRELGSGTFGTVYHGKWRGTDVAIKRINDRCFAGKQSEQERMRDDFWNEAIKLADLHHPNVVAFYGVVLDGPDKTVATVTEYMVNGSLRNALQKSERNLDKRKRLLIAMDVAFGMEYLHGKNIVHFDLKSDNLLVNLRDPHRPICKVGDLGLSKVKCQTLISGGVRGTLPWMAPELLNGSSSLVSEKVDVFSYGIVMWELLTGEEPYADLHYGAIIGGIVSNTLRPPVPEQCDPDWRELMERCWASEPSERPNFTEIANQLRAIAAKIPPKGQAVQANAQLKS